MTSFSSEIYDTALSAFYENTPFIIYPTYYTLNYFIVVQLCRAPIINFRFFNRRRSIHGTYRYPYVQISHDVMFHGSYTHGAKMNNAQNVPDLTFYTLADYELINLILDQLYSHYNYNEEILNELEKNLPKDPKDPKDLLETYKIEINKLGICYLLFIILHEFYGTNTFIQKDFIPKLKKLTAQYKKLEIIEIIKHFISDKSALYHNILNSIDWGKILTTFIGLLQSINDSNNIPYYNSIEEVK
jgi:hypothetical protein